MFPYVKIKFENGRVNTVVPSEDGLLGVCITGTAVDGTFALATAYILRSLDGLVTYGITLANNPHIYKFFKDFYDAAPEGTEVWFIGFPDTVKVSDMLDKTQNYGKLLLNAAGGKLQGLVVTRKPAVGYAPVITNGVDADVALAVTNGQALAVWAAEIKYAPIFALVEGYAYSGNPVELTDLATLPDNMVQVMIGDNVSGSKNASLGLLAGRIASISVETKTSLLTDGPITQTAFIGTVDAAIADTESIHNKGYVTFRQFVRKSGFYISDDPMATSPVTDDYNSLTSRRTINKAYRLSYDVLLEELNGKIPVTGEGKIPHAIIKAIQSSVEKKIYDNMTAKGELSADPSDPNDKAVICYIDANQPVQTTGELWVDTWVRQFGYAKYINNRLGFQVVSVS